ncbi:hypothetical protein BKA67DRAFT_541943 [Truncatella angustata]|uniref:Uncharacterized protein n=1 Tax=Truncatella angustata TaxID=152316 RepID=A0A9P8RF96_9PEZI|nr:uncharacterized protein BKA67DRAFT_541943 [Truncatella angustata]KAH6644948.1 hypothetical protein BKA67DRAFT_541943 [Truncatella angustata]KAH8204260.1 hypothetical protein TruAng_001546 [Truncatella angustata]
MQLSSILLGVFALTASALPQVPAERRAYTYTATVSDPGFYVYATGDYYENQILQYFNPTTTGKAALVARFPVGFEVGQLKGSPKIDVYTRTSAGIGSKIGSVGPLSISNNKVTKAVDVVVASLAYASSYTFEFKLDNSANATSVTSIQFSNDGFFLRTGSA